jgi:uracil-DNA glycosylase
MTTLVPPQLPTLPFNGIALVGEAPGEQEVEQGRPFCGPSGHLLDVLLAEVGIEREACYVTNVFKERPEGNNVGQFFIGRAEAKATGSGSNYSVYSPYGFLRVGYETHIAGLASELFSIRPRVIVALGATALWALTGLNGISAYRGSRLSCRDGFGPAGALVLPTYHPAAILRQYQLRAAALLDLAKAKEWSRGGEERTQRAVFIAESVGDLAAFEAAYFRRGCCIAFDVETEPHRGHITCVGFAPNGEVALVVPLWDKSAAGWSYWKRAADEAAVWAWLRSVLENESYKKVAHNCLYDVAYFAQQHGIRVRGLSDDTMAMAHALQPELRKDLGYLVSQYLNETAWKAYRPRGEEKEAG